MSKEARIFNTFPEISTLEDNGVFLVGQMINGIVKFRQFTKAGFIAQFVESMNELSELTDVAIVNPTNGNLLSYDATIEKWVNSSFVDLTPQTAPAYLRGRVWFDSDNNCLAYYDDIEGTSVQVGQEEILRARNSTGQIITSGQIVYVSGATGQNPRISLALANAESTSRVIGMATHDIANNTTGKITTFGLVNEINTSAFNDGDILYLSSSVAGGLTTTRPNSPNQAVMVGTVIHAHVTQGKILVHPSNYGIGLGTANQILGVNAGVTAQEYKTFSGTADQVHVTFGVGTVIFSLPQSIATTSTPTFAGLTLTTPLTRANGGTGLSTAPTNGQLLIGNGTTYALGTITGTANQVTVTNGAGTITLSLPQSINTGATPTFANVTLTNALLATSGGTGFNSYAVGDILFASTTTALSKLAGVATGNALISGGLNTAPSYGKIGLTTHISGTLAVGNGGTGITTTPSNGFVPIGNGTNYVSAALTGTSNQVVVTNGAGSITLSLPQSIATSSSPTFAGLTSTASVSVTGNVQLQSTGSNRFFLTSEGALGTGRLTMQAGAGSDGFGGAINLYAHAHPTKAGDVAIGLSTGSTGKFRVNTAGLDSSSDLLQILRSSGNMILQTGGTFTDISSAIFQITSTTKGFLPPRMTTVQKNAIATPTAGLVVYDTTLSKLCVYTTAWETITSA